MHLGQGVEGISSGLEYENVIEKAAYEMGPGIFQEARCKVQGTDRKSIKCKETTDNC